MEVIFEKLRQANINYDNVEKVCKEIFAGTSYKYSVGSTKVVIFDEEFTTVYKYSYGKVARSESSIYAEACANGVGVFFCPISPLSKDVEIQNPVSETLRDFVIRSEEKIQYGKFRRFFYELGFEPFLTRSDCVVLYWLLKNHSIDEVLKLQDFIMENDLTDLMYYNAGFYNGRVVFFDFAGTDPQLMD